MENSSKRYREENEACMRVQLIKTPKLEDLSKRAIEEFEIQYADYLINIKSQGSKTTKPIKKGQCVPQELREIIAMEKGIMFAELTEETNISPIASRDLFS